MVSVANSGRLCCCSVKLFDGGARRTFEAIVVLGEGLWGCGSGSDLFLWVNNTFVVVPEIKVEFLVVRILY